MSGIAAWGSFLAAAATVVSILVKWWWDTRPERREAKRREKNVDIHNEVAGGDVDAVRRRLRRMRAESD